MNLRTFLETLDISDHTDSARYPDGSGGRDSYSLMVVLDGHGKLLNAKVRRATVCRAGICITADGTMKGGKKK